ncbi:MAG: hypothetical protein KJ621_18235 [Proteobacteria bacterium]|nr:hypothetical protein [Pseudomonadota bacterium]MBU1742061.1 hypothetical protein [Pseudomonadota bacterium]
MAEHAYCDIETDVTSLGAFTEAQLQDQDFLAKIERQILIASQRVKTFTRHEWWDEDLPEGQIEAIPVIVRQATAMIAARTVSRPWDPESGEHRRLVSEKNDTHAYELSEMAGLGVSTGFTDTDEMLLPYRRPNRATVHLGLPEIES